MAERGSITAWIKGLGDAGDGFEKMRRSPDWRALRRQAATNPTAQEADGRGLGLKKRTPRLASFEGATNAIKERALAMSEGMDLSDGEMETAQRRKRGQQLSSPNCSNDVAVEFQIAANNAMAWAIGVRPVTPVKVDVRDRMDGCGWRDLQATDCAPPHLSGYPSAQWL